MQDDANKAQLINRQRYLLKAGRRKRKNQTIAAPVPTQAATSTVIDDIISAVPQIISVAKSIWGGISSFF